MPQHRPNMPEADDALVRSLASLHVYRYDVDAALAALNLTARAVALYHDLVAGDVRALRSLRLTVGMEEPAHADSFFYQHFSSRVSALSASTADPAQADLFWFPVSPYFLCVAAGEVQRDDLLTHTQRSLYVPCGTMWRAYAWLMGQPAWQLTSGARHVFFMNYKDRLSRAKGANLSSPAFGGDRSWRLLANSILVTAEDRLPQASFALRSGC
eukprot:3225255-Prymnesium_polylepis.1